MNSVTTGRGHTFGQVFIGGDARVQLGDAAFAGNADIFQSGNDVEQKEGERNNEGCHCITAYFDQRSEMHCTSKE